ncbi:MAG: Rrf2 family transcriptional regulator [Alphaproteobacteria bacterium]|nr:Rrf2 family transcriptional regulator [Alphaproteobacteria bacterium]
MNLNRRTDYALRVLLLLAMEPERAVDAPTFAERYGISVHHVRKVVQQLAQGGWVETRRGREGGVRLVQPPEAITVGAVVRAFEGDGALLECFDPARDTCPLTPACTLKRALAQAEAAFLAVLDGVTLAELAQRPAGMRRLLGMEPASTTQAPA